MANQEESFAVTISGPPGVGKSTVANLLLATLPVVSVISTDTIRDALRFATRPPDEERILQRRERDLLTAATFRAWTLPWRESGRTLGEGARVGDGSGPTFAEVEEGYLQQVALIMPVVKQILGEVLKRGNSILIEGVHVLGNRISAGDRVFRVHLDCADERSHMARFSNRAGELPARRRNTALHHSQPNWDAIRVVREVAALQSTQSEVVLDASHLGPQALAQVIGDQYAAWRKAREGAR